MVIDICGCDEERKGSCRTDVFRNCDDAAEYMRYVLERTGYGPVDISKIDPTKGVGYVLDREMHFIQLQEQEVIRPEMHSNRIQMKEVVNWTPKSIVEMEDE